MIIKILITLVFYSSLTFGAPKKEQLNFYTANEYPYQFDTQEGATFEILKGIYQMQNLPMPKLHFLTWSEAYNKVKSQKNTVLFTVSRRKAREKLFDWCCELYYAPVKGVFSLRGNGIKKQTDLKNKTGVVITDDTSEYAIDLLIKKIPSIKKITVSTFKASVKLFLAHKADFIIAKEPVLLDSCYKNKLNCRAILHVPTDIEIHRASYIVFNPKSNPRLRNKFLKNFNQFKATPSYKNILKKYGLRSKASIRK